MISCNLPERNMLGMSLAVVVASLQVLLLWNRVVLGAGEPDPFPAVQLRTGDPKKVVMDNGIVEVTLSSQGGDVTGIKFRGIDNLLEIKNAEDFRGYWDVVWNWPGKSNLFDKLNFGQISFSTVVKNDDILELSFARTWNNASDSATVPLIVDKRYIMRRGKSGFYTYAIFQRLRGWPDFDLVQARVVYKLNGAKFHYMVISDKRQRIMPTTEDRENGRKLDYGEAVLLTNPSNPNLKGEVDDKYQYSCENMDNKIHGWICTDPSIGFWMITPSNEFRTSGPVKQDLTSHVGPVTLNMFMSNHYAGKDVNTEFRNGEPWKKVFGPVFIYLNSASPKTSTQHLWQNAKNQMLIEKRNWPYDFVASKDYPSTKDRGTITGQLLILDRYLYKSYIWGKSAFVGLAAPGDAGSWQTESKGYQFWIQAQKKGYFRIKNVRAGEYNLFAWVPSILGDYRYKENITIIAGSEINLGQLIFTPPRHGPTLWQIGIPDRTAAEFYVPPPVPFLMNRLYDDIKVDRFRQYGLWTRYAEFYPNSDLVYTIGESNYQKDWFYAQVTRNMGNDTYVPTTWQIKFEIQNVTREASYKLQLALASATQSELEVRFNNQQIKEPHFSTGRIGWDNAIARHGIHGLYWYFGVDVPGALLSNGNNTLFLTQVRAETKFQGVMYDYIRLEGPQ